MFTTLPHRACATRARYSRAQLRGALLANVICAMLSAAALPTTVQASVPTGTTVDIGQGRRMYIVCSGPLRFGEPTVVLVSGYHDSSDPWTDSGVLSLLPQATGPAVFPGLARKHHVCAYDRPGTLRYIEGLPLTTRTTAVKQPRTAGDMIAELHRLLAAAKVPGRYILVGHSFGALVSVLYARTYPREIRGLVLVDGLSPAVPRTLGPRLWALYRRVLNPPAKKQPVPALGLPNSETVNIDESIAQVERTPRLPAMPVAVITKTAPFRIPASALPPGLTPQALNAGFNAAQDYFVKLAPTTPHIFATGSEHYVQLSQPDLVIETTELVLRRATASSN